MHESYEIVAGMITSESPQRRAARILALLEQGDRERVRAMIEARAARTAEAMDHELAAFDDE